jgi:hypothetical protein
MVGFLSRSRCVDCLLIPIAVGRAMDWETWLEVVEVEVLLATLSISSLPRILGGNLLGEASRSAALSSRSTSS